MAHPVDLFVDLAFLLDIGIGPGNIGFGLVIVIVADEILNRVVWEKAFEFSVKLGGQSLVWGENDGGALGFFNHLGHGKGLAGARCTKQHLIPFARQHALGQFSNRGRLVARRLERRLHHKSPSALQFGAS